MCRIAVLLFVCFQGIALWSQPILESLAKSELAAAKGMYQSYAKRSGDAGVDITYAALFMEPDMNSGRIREGAAAFTFTCKASISTLDFDLRTDLRADSIVFNGLKLPFTHLNHVLTVSFPTALLQGTSHRIKIFYQGQPDMSSRAYFRTVNASGPNLSTLSQPYGAPYWWPCRDNLTDKIDSLDIQLRVDTPYTAVSNGVLVSTVNEGSRRLFSFRHRYPIVTYLVAVTFSRYTAYTQTASLGSLGKSLNVVNYVFPHNNLNQSMNQTAETAGIMHLFDSLFGSYPFHREQYGHAQFAWGGGMEHQTMSFMVNFSYDLIAHELAHQWFGDMITCGSWKDIWLNEGFATYANLLCYNTPGKDTEWIERLRKNKTEIMSRPDGSVYAYDTGNVSRMFDYRTTYQKGALVLHQLRWVVGDNAFFNAIRAYASDTGLVYGFALQKDLKHYMELYSGMDLTDYFNDWIMGEGYPEYDIRWQQNGQTLHLEIFQQPSHSSVNAFNVPLPFVIKGLGKDSFIRVPINGLQTFFNINPGFRVQKVEFDPREWVLAKASLKFPAFSGQEAVSVYPNPFNGRFYVSLTEAEVGSWSIYDLCGKQVESARLSAYMPAGSILEIEAEGLAAGMYVLKLETPDSTILRKIIKAD